MIRWALIIGIGLVALLGAAIPGPKAMFVPGVYDCMDVTITSGNKIQTMTQDPACEHMILLNGGGHLALNGGGKLLCNAC